MPHDRGDNGHATRRPFTAAPPLTVYLDHNATTFLRDEVRAEFERILALSRGNPSSLHTSGRAARTLVDDARERVASALGVLEDEVFFTAGATEANHLALSGALRATRPGRIVLTKIEHPSVLGPVEALERAGHELTWVGVDRSARVDLAELAQAADGATLLALSAANNEVGTLASLAALNSQLTGASARPLIFSDCVQALGRVELDLHGWGLDLASFSCHKLGGPLGCGVLYKRRGVGLDGPVYGGGQESGVRPGTENVPAIVAGALAIELACAERALFVERAERQTALLWKELKSCLPDACLLGPTFESGQRLCNTLALYVPGIDGRVLVTRLDLAGVQVGAGSACSSGSLEPSHVMRAMGYSDEESRAGIRLSVGLHTSDEDIHTAVDIMRITLGSERKS